MGPLTNLEQVAGGLWVKLCYKHYRKEKLPLLSSEYMPRTVLGFFTFIIYNFT